MKTTTFEIPGLLLFEPKCFGDTRGWFLETYNRERYAQAGLDTDFVQDNMSYSQKGVLRGLHYQKPNTQGKLVYAIEGEVWDVVVDLRVGSPTFGRWQGVRLSKENRKQFYVPPGFAHGFRVLSEAAQFFYKCTDFYNPQAEHSLLWNDPDLAIDWQTDEAPLLKDKDAHAPRLRDIPKENLFVYRP